MGMIEIDKSDVRQLLQNPELVEEIAKGVMEDPSALDDLAEDIASALAGGIENDPQARRSLVTSALSSQVLKEALIQKLVRELR